MSDLISKRELYKKLGEAFGKGYISWGENEIIKDIIGECDPIEKNNEERLKDIRGWLIENIFREDYVMYSDAREVNGIDLIEVIASLYNEYHNAVMGEPYDYMFHWANKCGSWVNEDLFDRVLKDDK